MLFCYGSSNISASLMDALGVVTGWGPGKRRGQQMLTKHKWLERARMEERSQSCELPGFGLQGVMMETAAA